MLTNKLYFKLYHLTENVRLQWKMLKQIQSTITEDKEKKNPISSFDSFYKVAAETNG